MSTAQKRCFQHPLFLCPRRAMVAYLKQALTARAMSELVNGNEAIMSLCAA